MRLFDHEKKNSIALISILGFLLFLSNKAPAVTQSSKHEQTSVAVEAFKGHKVTKGGKTDKPSLSKAEIYAVAVQKKLIKGIDTTIAYLRKTVNKFPKKSDSRYEVQIRLINLYLENAIYVSSEEQRIYSQKWDRWSVSGRKGDEPKLDTSKSNQLWQNVERQAIVILQEYPKAKNADQVIFNQALAQQFLGREKDAARTFSALIQKFPNSAAAGDAYFALGDFYFDKNDYRNAYNNYKSALRYNRSKRYGWALFKLGWCNYNLGNYREALAAWKQTVTYSRTAGDYGARLKEEALRDMVFGFAELKEVDSAISYYRANGGGEYISKFLLLLADTLVSNGNFESAIQVYKKFQSMYPADKETPNTQKEIVSLYYEKGNLNALWLELASLSRNFGTKSSWASKNTDDRKLILETQKMIKDQLIYYPKLVHNRAIQTQNSNGYAHAIKGYELFLKSYPDAKEAIEVKYLMADILFFQKQYANAGRLYLEIALTGKENAIIVDAKTQKEQNIHKISSKYMLDSFLLDFEPEFKILMKNKPDLSKPPRPISAKASNFIKGCGYYANWYTDDKPAIKNCDIYISEIYYRNNDKKRALTYFWAIAQKYSKEPEGPKAVETIIPMYKDDKKGLLLAADKLLKIPEYNKGELGKKLSSLRWNAENEEIAKESNAQKRARLYEAQARKNPNAKETEALWNNAAVDYLKSGEALAAIAAYKVLQEKFPKSPLNQDATLQSAMLYDKLMNFKVASVLYLGFVKKYPNAKEVPGAYSKACDLQIAINHPDAEATCLAFAAKYPKAGAVVVSKLINFNYRHKKFDHVALLVNREYVPKYNLSSNDKIIAYHKIYTGFKRTGQQASTAVSSILAEYRKNPAVISGEALRYIGEIYFSSVGDVLEEFKKIKLQGGTVDAMLASIQKMTQGIKAVEARYQKVLETKDAYHGVAALYNIGVAYLYFATALENPPAITGAKSEDVKKQLEPQSAALKKEAATYFANAEATVTKFNVYNDWAIRVANAQAQVKGSNRNFEEIVITPDFASVETSGKVAAKVR